jgi:hypothetical protein
MKNELKKRAYLYATIALFSLSIILHYYTSYNSYVGELEEHNETFNAPQFYNEFGRQVFENWQSEFLQIIWQVGGLALLFMVASPQDKGGDKKKEKMLEEILRRVNPVGAEKIIKDLNDKYQ